MDTLGRLAPTIGGVLGGIGGEIVDPFGGGIAGAALGSGIGKGVENASQGQNPLQANDLVAGVEGGLGQGVGDVAGAALGKIGGVLGNIGSKTIENAKTVDEFGSLPQNIREKFNLDNSLNLAKQAGIPKTANDFATAPGVATGENGVLNGTLDSIVNQSASETGQGVNIGGYRDAITKAINDRPELGSLEPTTAGGGGMPKSQGMGSLLSSKLNDLVQQFGFGGEGSLTEASNPDQALQLLRESTRLGNTFGNSLTTEGQAQKYVYDQFNNFLKDRIYNTPEVKQAISNYTTSPEDDAAILKATGGNQKYAQFISDTLNNAKKSSDITDVQRQLIDMRGAGEAAVSKNATILPGETQDNSDQAISAAGHLITGNKAGLMGAALKSAGGIKGTLANKAGNVLDRMSMFTGQNPNSGILNKLPGAAGTATATAPNAVAPQQGGNMQQPPMPGQVPGQSPQSPLMGGYNTALGMMTLDPYLASSLAPVVNSLAPQAQKFSQAQSLLPQVEQAFQQAGGGQGPILGGLSKIGGALTGGPSATYGKIQAQLQALLAQLGLPQSYVPSITQNAPSGAMGFQGLNSILGTVPPTQQ